MESEHLGDAVADAITTKGEVDALEAVPLEGGAIDFAELPGAPDRSDVPNAVAPEREGVDDRLREHDLAACEGQFVPDAGARFRRFGHVEVERRALSEPCRDLPPVQSVDVHALGVEDRHDDGPVEVLVASVAEDPELLKTTANMFSFPTVLVREPVAERAVCEPDLEALDHRGVVQPSGGEVPKCLGALLERRVVEVHDANEKLLVGGVPGHDARELRRAPLLRRRPRVLRAGEQ